MFKLKINPTLAISFELALIAMSISSLALTLGVLPKQEQSQHQLRSQHAKSLAVQISLAMQTGKEKTIQSLLDLSIEQYTDLESIAILKDDEIAISTPGHTLTWLDKTDIEKSKTNYEFEIPRANKDPLKLQLCYKVPELKWYQSASFRLGSIVMCGSFIMYFLFVRKMLKKAIDSNDNNADQVNEIFNTMSEAVVVVDNDEKIILANNEFLNLACKTFTEIKDTNISKLRWQDNPPTMPWSKSIQEKNVVKGENMTMEMVDGTTRNLIANSTPVKNNEDDINGVMITLNDVTELFKQNQKIKEAMSQLKENHKKIQEQNAALKEMSMQDPLTGCLNRRAFFEIYETEWSSSKRYGYEISCIMMDIDFFKKVNDNHGHSKGDEVLRVVPKVINEMVRKSDHICRYGGEEFCILMPHTTVESAEVVAEKIRAKVEEVKPGDLPTTISLGISATCFEAKTPQELIDQADKALYFSKHNGRNQYTRVDKIDKDFVIEGHEEKPKAQENSVLTQDTTFTDIPFQAVNALVNALEQRDAMTGMHCRRVADLCVAIARPLMDQTDLYILEVAALLHDIGKIGVPDSILTKTSELTTDEYNTVNYHMQRGSEIIESSFHSSELTGILKYTRAWYSGTPNQPELPIGEKIPLRSRIIMAATAFDSMITDSAYREGKSYDEAIAELQEKSPEQFDPMVVSRITEVVSARVEERAYSLPNDDEIKALRIGLEIEKLICAVEAEDIALMSNLAKSLAKDAVKLDIPEVAYPAEVLSESIDTGKHMADILVQVNEIINECNKQNEKRIAEGIKKHSKPTEESTGS